jgi:hypothetical protein
MLRALTLTQLKVASLVHYYFSFDFANIAAALISNLLIYQKKLEEGKTI